MLYFKTSVLKTFPSTMSTFLYLEYHLSNECGKASLWEDFKYLLWQWILEFWSSVWHRRDQTQILLPGACAAYNISLHRTLSLLNTLHQLPCSQMINLKCKATSTKFSEPIHSWDKYKPLLPIVLQKQYSKKLLVLFPKEKRLLWAAHAYPSNCWSISSSSFFYVYCFVGFFKKNYGH